MLSSELCKGRSFLGSKVSIDHGANLVGSVRRSGWQVAALTPRNPDAKKSGSQSYSSSSGGKPNNAKLQSASAQHGRITTPSARSSAANGPSGHHGHPMGASPHAHVHARASGQRSAHTKAVMTEVVAGGSDAARSSSGNPSSSSSLLEPMSVLDVDQELWQVRAALLTAWTYA